MERRVVNWVRPSSLRHSSVVLNIAVYEKRRRRRRKEEEDDDWR